MIDRRHVQSLLWGFALSVAAGLCLGLMLHVKAVTSEITRVERRILAVKREQFILETEFQARARQQQLSRWNDIDFGYVAPGADQFIDNRRELAMLGKPAMIEGPGPIQLAAADHADLSSAARSNHDDDDRGGGAEDDGGAGDDADTIIRPSTRLALAEPAPAIRQLAARDVLASSGRSPLRIEPASISRAAPLPEAAGERARQPASTGFAERFDLDAVIANARTDANQGH